MTAPLTDNATQTARERARMNRQVWMTPESDDLAPARGIFVGVLIGLALCLVLGIVIYFTCF